MDSSKKLKIVLSLNGRPHQGGMTSLTNSFADALRSEGHEVDILTIFGISKYREINDKFVLRTDKLLKHNNVLTFLVYLLSKFILGIRFFVAQRKNKYEALLALDISIVNATKIPAKLLKVPSFLAVQSSIHQDLLNQGKISKNSFVESYIKSQEKKAYQKAIRIIANSDYTVNYIKSINPSHSEITVIRQIVNNERFAPNKNTINTIKKQYQIDKDKWVILFIGRIVTRKGLRYLTEAYSQFVKLYPDSLLVIVGKGEQGDPEIEHVNEIISQHKIEDKVKFLGIIPYEVLSNIYNIADTLVAPSVTHQGLQEPLGQMALESMATGTPVIASEIGGLKEVIKNNINGLLVPEKDPEAILEALIKLKTDQELRESLIKNALHDISENYSPSKVAQKIINVIT